MSLYKTLFETPENKLKVGIIGMVIITFLLAGVFYVEAQSTEVLSLDDIENISMASNNKNVKLQESILKIPETGYTNENEITEIPLTIENEKLLEVSCTLTWIDEPTSYFRGTNEPDSFQVIIKSKNGETRESGMQSSGSASTSFELPDYNDKKFKETYIGDWIITVEAGDCGDDQSITGFRTTPDTGNDWTLVYNLRFMEEVEIEE